MRGAIPGTHAPSHPACCHVIPGIEQSAAATPLWRGQDPHKQSTHPARIKRAVPHHLFKNTPEQNPGSPVECLALCPLLMKRARINGLLSAAMLTACVTAHAGVYSSRIVGGGESSIPIGTTLLSFSEIWHAGPFSVQEEHGEKVGIPGTFDHRTTVWLGTNQLLSVPLTPRHTGLTGLALALAACVIAGVCWRRRQHTP